MRFAVVWGVFFAFALLPCCCFLIDVADGTLQVPQLLLILCLLLRGSVNAAAAATAAAAAAVGGCVAVCSLVCK
jgi:hypothetical protein